MSAVITVVRSTQFQEINEEDIKLYEQKIKCEDEIKELKKKIRKTEDVILKDELAAMDRFMKKLCTPSQNIRS